MLAMALLAGDMENRSGVESEVASTARWLVRLRGETRSNNHYQDISNNRAQAEANYMAQRHVALVSITQFLETQAAPSRWQTSVRQMSGVELLSRTSRFSFLSRTLEEHYFQTGQDYDRFRQRGLVRLRKLRWQPQAGGEIFLDGQGWAGTRAMANAQLPAGRYLGLNFGYFYEFRPSRLGGSHHVVYTYINIRRARS